MRCLDRDRRCVYLSRYIETVPVKDDNGRFTGRNEPVREEPVAFFPTVSAVRGAASEDYFGQKLDYDRTITIDDHRFEIAEADVLWIDRTPDDDTPYDYVVVRVARTSNYTVIAAKHSSVGK